MKLPLIAKTILIAVFSVLATTLTTTGWPADALHWQLLGIIVLGTCLVHIAQSLFIPGTSIPGDLNKRDLLKGLLLSIGTALSDFAGAYVTGLTVNWLDVGKLVITTAILYLGKNLLTTGTGK